MKVILLFTLLGITSLMMIMAAVSVFAALAILLFGAENAALFILLSPLLLFAVFGFMLFNNDGVDR